MSNWSILNFPYDPTPGDAGAVETMSSTYNRNGQTFSDLADFINSIGKSPEMVGEYAEKFASEITPLVGEFQTFAESFEQVGTALNGWAAELPTFQRVSQDCLTRAEAAESDRIKFEGLVGSQRGEVRSAKWEAFRASDDDQRSADRRLSNAESVLANYQDKLSTAVDELELARQDAHSNWSDYTTSASRYADTVDMAQDHAPQISWWETVYYSSTWKIIVQVAVVVAIAATFAGFFLGGWVLPLIGLITSLVVFSDDLMGFFAGDTSGWELALSTVFLALSGLSNVGRIADAFGEQGRLFWKAGEGILSRPTRFRWAISTFGEDGAKAFTYKGFAGGVRDMVRPGALKWSDLKKGKEWIDIARTLPAAQRKGEFLMGIGRFSGVLNKTKPIVQAFFGPGPITGGTFVSQIPVVGETQKAVQWVRDFSTNTATNTREADVGTVLRHFTTQPAPNAGLPAGATQPGITVPDRDYRPLEDLGSPLNPQDFIVTPPPTINEAPAQPSVDFAAPSQHTPSMQAPSAPVSAPTVPTPSPTPPVSSPNLPEPAVPAETQSSSSPSNSSSSQLTVEMPNIDLPAVNESLVESAQAPAESSGIDHQSSDSQVDAGVEMPTIEAPNEQRPVHTKPDSDSTQEVPVLVEDDSSQPAAAEPSHEDAGTDSEPDTTNAPPHSSTEEDITTPAPPAADLPEQPVSPDDHGVVPGTEAPTEQVVESQQLSDHQKEASQHDTPGTPPLTSDASTQDALDQPTADISEPAIDEFDNASTTAPDGVPSAVYSTPPVGAFDMSSSDSADSDMSMDHVSDIAEQHGVQHEHSQTSTIGSHEIPAESVVDSDADARSTGAHVVSNAPPEDMSHQAELGSVPCAEQTAEKSQPVSTVLPVGGGSTGTSAINPLDDKDLEHVGIRNAQTGQQPELVRSH